MAEEEQVPPEEERGKFHHFFYEQRVPEKDELVMVRVNTIDDMGVMCSLLEYDNLEGFLPLSEISRKRMRSVLRHVRVGQKQVLQVIRVDTERGYTDLSKKYVAEEERVKGTDKYTKAKTVHQIAKRLAETQHKDFDEIFSSYIWPLKSKYDHPLDAFRIFAADELDIFADADIEMDAEFKDALKKIVHHQLAVQPVKMGAEIEIRSYEGGIVDIKKALTAGLEAGQKDGLDIKIQLISSPTYLIWTTTVDEVKGTASLEGVISVIEEEITSLKGMFTVRKEIYKMLGRE